MIGRCHTCRNVYPLRDDGLVPTHQRAGLPLACPGSQEPPAPRPDRRTAACPICLRPSQEPHTACHNLVHADLRSIPQLYCGLAAALEPGRSPSAHVSGSRLPPLPLALQPLTLRSRGGIVTMLATWETDWRDLAGLTPTARAGSEQLLADGALLDQIVEFLCDRLWWAVDHHPAVQEFAQEVRQIVRDCHTALGDRDESRAIGRCPALRDDGHGCGVTLRAYPNASAVYCTACGTEWPRYRWAMLGEILEADREKAA